jgi:outer membrane protein assembly factor BamB
VPLTDIWTVPGEGPVTWHGRAYYLGASGERAALVCVDLRTGVEQWKRALNSLSKPPKSFAGSARPRRGPLGVTAEGVVYVQDYIPEKVAAAGISTDGVKTTLRVGVEYSVKAYRAVDGSPVGLVSSADKAPLALQAILFDGPDAPFPRTAKGRLLSLGPGLIRGNEITAGSIGDCLFNWSPGRPANLLSIAHAGADASLLNLDLGAFPLASSGSGLVVGGMSAQETPVVGLPSFGRQHLAVMSGERCLWHRDFPWSLGFPAVENDLILTGAGRPAADTAIMAHAAATGMLKWVYPPDQLRPDRVAIQSGAVTRSGPGGGALVGSRNTYSANMHAHLTHPGIAVSGGHAYGVASGSLVALDLESGAPVWSWPIPGGEVARSVVCSPDYVLVSLDQYTSTTPFARLVALRVTDGKPEWSQTLPGGGDLALSDGLLLLSDGAVHAFAPAERTYRMAVDSSRREDYEALPGRNGDPLSEGPAEEVAKSRPRQAYEEFRRARVLADATVVRLHWGDPLDQMLKEARDRHIATSGLPLLVSMDWLDPTRTTIRGGQAEWSERDIGEFAAVCARVAREVGPDHLDLAPEVDVYLARDLNRLSTVRALLRAATAAVKKASPRTKVLISLNREVLARRYGQGNFSPFGKLGFLNRDEQAQLMSLLDEVDEVGLTSIPQSAFRSPLEIPGDYLLSLKAVLPAKKPLLITQLAIRYEEKEKNSETSQASYLRHLFQTAYWLNYELVAYPDLLGSKRPSGDKTPDLALRVEGQDRLAAAYWRDALQWKRVDRLTAAAADLDR